MNILAKTSICLSISMYCSLSGTGQGWYELKSDVINCYTTSEISALSKDPTGTIVYAGIGPSVLKWQGTGWTKLGSLNANSDILSLVVDAAGNVYAAGAFSNSTGYGYVAKWNGYSWNELGAGANALAANSIIYSIAVDGSGNVYAGGSFTNSVGKKYVAKWNGNNWSELGGTGALNANDFVNAVTTDAAGNVYAGGNFTNASNKRYVAKWDGTNWSELGGANSLNANSNIRCLHADPANNIYTGGQFTNASNRQYVAKYNGSTWSEVGTGVNALNANGFIWWVTTDPSGNIYTAGSFENANSKKYVAKWNGSNWSEVGIGPGALNATSNIDIIVRLNNGDLYTAGEFMNATNQRYVARWNNSTNIWAEAGVGGVGILTSSTLLLSAIVADPSLNVYVAGTISEVFKWNGNIWSVVGSSISTLHANAQVLTIAIDGANNIYAAGDFTNGPDQTIGDKYVAKWDGNIWTELGAGVNALHANDRISKVVTDAAGNVYAGGYFKNASGKYYVAKWNGTNWSELGGLNALNANGEILDIAIDGSGNLYAGGRFHFLSNFVAYVAKWNGTSWSIMGNDFTNHGFWYSDLICDVAGNVYAVGDMYSNSNHIVTKWNGAIWAELGTGSNALNSPDWIHALGTDNAGNIYAAGGHIIAGGNGYNVAKWNGNNWSELGTGINELAANNYIRALGSDNSGRIFAAGEFKNQLGQSYVAAYSANYPGKPMIAQVNNKCPSSPTSKGKLLNPSPIATINITLDGVSIPYTAADSSFTYFTNGVTASGNHLVSAKYSNASYTVQTDTNFVVSQPVGQLYTPLDKTSY